MSFLDVTLILFGEKWVSLVALSPCWLIYRLWLASVARKAICHFLRPWQRPLSITEKPSNPFCRRTCSIWNLPVQLAWKQSLLERPWACQMSPGKTHLAVWEVITAATYLASWLQALPLQRKNHVWKSSLDDCATSQFLLHKTPSFYLTLSRNVKLVIYAIYFPKRMQVTN